MCSSGLSAVTAPMAITAGAAGVVSFSNSLLLPFLTLITVLHKISMPKRQMSEFCVIS